jgi:RES domain-containing protein
MLEQLARSLEAGHYSSLSTRAFRHVAPSFDPLSTRGAELHGGRWNARGTPALYLALSVETARAEFDRLVRLRGTSAEDLLPRTLATIRVRVDRLIEARRDSITGELGVEGGRSGELSMKACRAAGELVAGTGGTGLIAPSATGTGSVLVVFTSNLEIEDELEVLDQVEVRWT